MNLVKLDRFGQCLEIAFAETFIAFALASNPSESFGVSLLRKAGLCKDKTKHHTVPMTKQPPHGWVHEADGKALTKRFIFADFSEAFAFLTRVAAHAEAVDHHPEFTSVWNRVDFRLTSHDRGEVTKRDIALAEAIDRLAQN